jgi:hypothetical protein
MVVHDPITIVIKTITDLRAVSVGRDERQTGRAARVTEISAGERTCAPLDSRFTRSTDLGLFIDGSITIIVSAITDLHRDLTDLTE